MAREKKIAKNTVVSSIPKEQTEAPGVRYCTGDKVYQVCSDFFRENFYLWECLPDGSFRFIATAGNPLELYRIAEEEEKHG